MAGEGGAGVSAILVQLVPLMVVMLVLVTEIGILRCRTCGGLYRWYRFEINDWTGGNDYSDETQVWQVLAEDEVERVRTDDNYEPRGGREHRSDSGWKSVGP